MSVRAITLTIFLGAFFTGLATVNYFNHFYAKRALESDAEQLLYQFHDALLEAHKILDSLPEPDQFQCNEATIAQLAQLAYEHPAVRLIGLLHGEQQTCASEPIYIDLSDYHQRVMQQNNHQLASDLALAVAGAEDKPDFLMVRSHGGSRYFASINPFMVNYLAEFACVNCLEYEFVIAGLPKLQFRSRGMDGESVIEYQSFRYEETVKVDLRLRGTADFYNFYKELSWLSTAVFAALLAGVIALLCYRLLTIRQSLDRVIKDALKYQEFEPFYQPIVDSRDGRVVGAEVLARWRQRDGSIVPPYQFIPYAEANGLIIAITEQLIKKVAADIAVLGWQDSGQFMSVNIVPEHLYDNDLYDLVTNELDKGQLSASSISLEITERMKIDNLELARQQLDRFYDKGIKLKLDDAGTGYGGFSYIQELGISTLKIDKMFIDTINSDDVKGSVLEAIISFVKSSGLGMIAEGVEDQEQVEYLKQHEVFYIQGYVYGKPMPINEFRDWLSNA